jgi:hypothetical protein
MGDGFFGAGSSTTAKFAEQVQIVRGALAEAGQAATASRSPNASTSASTTTPSGRGTG